MEKQQVVVWDLGVRIFHWSLVVLFIFSYLSGDEFEELHAYSGYIIISLLVFRLVWGFVGSQHARFADFVRGPRTVIDDLKSIKDGHPRRYLGHNPAGGAMIVMLLVGLSLLTFSGLMAYAAEGHGPLAGTDVSLISTAHADDDHDEGDEKEEDEFWEEIHEFMGNFMLLLIFLHIAGVVVSSRLQGENLVKAMMSGKKEVG
ncbi:MAG: cytochrome b/b6 domain-containing protein [Gammaproteobacteria bacterium]|nr:cytochrome b/b6 domain-containing protein [Gammaproteobacteria bacterium]